MNKLITTFCLVLISLTGFSQNCFWHENMEVIDSVTSVGTPTWTANTRISHSGLQCDSVQVGTGTVSYLETDVMDLTGNIYVQLSFWHICRIDFFDGGTVEYSNDGGVNWQPIPTNLFDPTLPTHGAFTGQGGVFTSATSLSWDPANPGTVATNAMWELARWDVSSIVGGQNQIKFRLKLSDLSNPGPSGYPGWFVDDICVEAAPCELIPPVVTYINPLQGTVYNLGPFNVFADITDGSGLLTQDLTYTVNSGAPTTIAMTFVTGNTWTAQIPAVLEGDTVCYSITAVDNSGCNNSTTSNTLCFITSNGVTFPYCDNFDITTNLWVDSGAVAGSIWELGTPNTWPAAPHSAPNSWEVALNQPYANNTLAYLYSPVFSFTGVANASIELWVDAQCENFWDGTNLQCDTTGSGNWFIIGNCAGNDPNPGTNWYNQCSINSVNEPAWSGTSQVIAGQPGWFKAKHSLSMLDNVQYAQFRFQFSSDASVTGDGIGIDDICITVPSPQDAGVAQIYQPGGQAPAGACIPVSVLLQNMGSQPITTTTVTYVQTSGAGMPQTGTVTWNGFLNPNDTATVIITPCFTVPAGPFCVQAYTSLVNDGNFFNDSTTICGIGIPVLTPTICDDFESGNVGWVASPNTATGWNLGAPAYGATTGAHSGTNAWDINLTGPFTNNQSDTLYTPIYDMSSPSVLNPNISFWQNRNVNTGNDGMRIEYETNSNGIWQVLGVYQDGNGSNWYNQANVNFSAIPGWDGNSNGWQRHTYFLAAATPFPGTQFIRFRFIFTSGFNIPLDGVSIDDFCVNIPCANDVGVTYVNSYTQFLGGSAAEGTQDSVTVTLHNYGTANQSTANITYQIVQNGVPVFTSNPYTWNGTLTTNLPGWNATNIILPQTFTVPAGAFQIIAWVTLTGDCDAANDTLNIGGVGVPVIAIDYNTPYCDDFESGNVGWTVNFGTGGDPGSIWEFGLPNVAPTNTAHSGTTAWDITLNAPYTNNANVYLTSPIFDFTNAVDTRLDFWQNWSTENGWDGTHMEVSVNNGPWTHFGNCQAGLPANTAFNWYTGTINSNPGINCAWEGLSSGWQQSIWFNLSNNPQTISFNGQPKVQFRFQFTSDASVTGIGYSIDDFCLTVPVPLTTTPTAITDLPTTPHLNFPGQSICFRTTIKNDGTTAINSTAVQLVIDNTPISLDTVNYSPALASGASQNYQFSTCWTGAPGLHTVCAITSYPNQSTDLKPVNDTICYTILIFDSAQIGTQPKCYDFEAGPQWVTLNSINLLPTSSWTLGQPAKTTINTAHSGTNAWVTGTLTGNYSNRDTSSLFSPLFIINGALNYNITFWTAFKTEKNEDGGTLEYSSDYGVTWKQLGNQQSPNWMNTLDITALQIGAPGPVPHAGWSGNATGWASRGHDFCLGMQGVQNVIFRWRFNSDFSVEDEGWAIDDVCITPLTGTCPVGVEEVSESLELLQNQPNPFDDVTAITFSIKEKGHTELQILDITGQLISTPISEELSVGNYTVNLHAGSLASGVYFYALKHNDTRMVRKMVVAK